MQAGDGAFQTKLVESVGDGAGIEFVEARDKLIHR
jgi:hypothetical protein